VVRSLLVLQCSREQNALHTLIHQRHLTPSCGGHAPTAERTLHPARMFTESLTPRPELENSRKPHKQRPHWLAGVGGFELSDPEKPPLEHGLTATEGRSARHIHCRMDRMDWTGVQVTLWQLSREKSLIAKRSEMKGNSGHTSKANFGSAFVSSNPPTPASQCGLSYAISGDVGTGDIPAG